MKKQKALAMLLASMMLLVILTGCGSSQGTQDDSSGNAGKGSILDVEISKEGSSNVEYDDDDVVTEQVDSLIIAADDDGWAVRPFYVSQGEISSYAGNAIYACLAYRPFIGAMLDNGLELEAAKEVTKIDDTTYAVTIYDNITDSKGNHITAADVVFSLDANLALGYSYYLPTCYVSSVATGDYELEITIKTGAEGEIEQVLSEAYIVSQSWYENATEDDLLNDPACTGRYYVTEVQSGHLVTIEARDDYWKSENLTTYEKAAAKVLQFVSMTEADTRAIALQNGEVDMAQVDFVSVESIFDQNDDYNVFAIPKSMSNYINFNSGANSPCNDVNVRKAIAYAIDVDSAYVLGYGSPSYVKSYDICPNTTPDYLQEWLEEDCYSQDVDKAKEYLNAAGYGEGELTIRMLVVAQAPQGFYQAMQQQLIDVGIDCEIVGVDRAVFESTYADSTQWDITCHAGSATDFTTSFWSRIFSEDVFGQERGTEGFAIDSGLQDLLRTACASRSTEDIETFHNYYLYEQCYMYPTCAEVQYFVARKGIVDLNMARSMPVPVGVSFTDDYKASTLQQ